MDGHSGHKRPRLPALSQAAYVFDEIHEFYDRLFAALLRFLRDLPGLTALLMTANLPKTREIALRELLGTLELFPGPDELEERPRYRKSPITGNDPLQCPRPSPRPQRALSDAGYVPGLQAR
jgi:CRISPR-associated endonuclease/helicase Cas3